MSSLKLLGSLLQKCLLSNYTLMQNVGKLLQEANSQLMQQYNICNFSLFMRTIFCMDDFCAVLKFIH